MANCFWAMPALATATSRPPSFSTTSATAAIIAPWSVTSAPIPIARAPIRSAASRGLLGVEVEDRDRGAAHVHLARGLEADPAGGAGDQRNLAVEVVAHRGTVGRAALAMAPRPRDPVARRPGHARIRPVDPKQSFPELEERVLERWRERRRLRALARRTAPGAEVWSFYEGPPTANGRPGSHHVLARVFKDIYPRYKTMCGYRVPRKAGWDCHGLPVELEVEKQLGISSKQEIEEFGIAEFNQRCRESVFEYVEEWNRLTERIGFWIDLDDPYVTLEDDYIESVWWSLRKLWDEGRLYEGHKVVPYCPRAAPPLSSHEVAQGYKDVEDPSIYVRFPLLDGAGASGRVAAGLDDDALDAAGQRRRRRRPGGHLRAGRARRRDR